MGGEVRLIPLVALLGACGAASHAPPEPLGLPRPGPLGRADAAARNAECEACHPDVAEEWRRSLHRHAFTSPDFQRSLAGEPQEFCRGCHAPEARRGRADPEAEALGVGCVTCHVPKGEVILAGDAGAVAGAAAHPIVRDARFASADACAGCHEFAFPDRRPVPEFMQTTIREHRQALQRERTCVDCHMPRAREGPRSHAFTASRDDAWLRQAVRVEARRPAPDRVELSLALQGDAAGHAFPTGDLLRRLAVEVRSRRRQLHPTTRTRYLARHWRLTQQHHGPPVRSEIGDDRLAPDGIWQHLIFALDPADEALPVRWQVRYERVLSFVNEREEAAIVAGAVTLAEGVLAPPSLEAPPL